MNTSQPIAFILCDIQGRVLDFTMNADLFPTIKKEMPLEEVHPVFVGIFPFQKKILKLARIELLDGAYFDCTFSCSNKNTIEITITDVSDEVEELRPLVQKINEKVMKSYSLDNKGFPKFDHLLASLEMACMAWKGGLYFEALGKMPDWLVKLKPDADFQGCLQNIADLFPFLEIFMLEASELWNDPKNGRIMSGPWTEEAQDGSQYLIQAQALKIDGKMLLCLERPQSSILDSADVIQKARRQALDYERIEKAEAAIRNVLKFKDQFVSMVSHDLRSPIAALHGLTLLALESAKNNELTSEAINEYLHDMNSELEHLLDYNSKLYHWSNVQLGNFRIELSDIGLNKLLNKTYQSYVSAIQGKNIEFHIQIDDSIKLRADAALLRQVFNNLLGNAVKFTPAGGKISFESKRSKDGLFIDCRDSGIGMPEEMRRKLFKTEGREITKLGTAGEKGSGLGLGIIKKILDAHQFGISVISAPNEGSVFRVFIPDDALISVS